MKSSLQYTGTQLAAARRLGRLCYRPAVFFTFSALSFQKGKTRDTFRKCYYIHFLILKKIVIVKLRKFKCRNWSRFQLLSALKVTM
jgi:hypothetical protein